VTYNLRFAGQQYEAYTGLNQNWFRDYDPNTGRYIQADPIGLSGGWNRYGYVGGDPLTSTDPMGLSPTYGMRFGAAAGFWLGGPPGALIGAGFGLLGGYLATNNLGNLTFATPGNQSRPSDAPNGTLPITGVGLGRGDIHDIKRGVGARPNDWTGITPDGDVITSDPSGRAANHGPADQFTRRPTGLCPS
jgi:RHS repeat-associated protein